MDGIYDIKENPVVNSDFDLGFVKSRDTPDLSSDKPFDKDQVKMTDQAKTPDQILS